MAKQIKKTAVKRKRPTVSFTLAPESYKQLQALAERDKRSPSNMIEVLVQREWEAKQ